MSTNESSYNMSTTESSALPSETEDEVPLTPALEQEEDAYVQREKVRESIITYSTVGESSIAETTTTDLHDNNTNSILPNIIKSPSGKGVPSERFYQRKRFWVICIAVNIILSAIFIPLLFLVLIPSAVQSSMSQSNLVFESINITHLTNDSFVMNSVGKVRDTGPFGASITFIGGVNVLYKGNLLGAVELDPIEVSGGSGVVTGTNNVFKINNKSLFSDLASTMMVTESFQWTIQGTANVKSFGTITKVTLDKDVKVPGSGGFETTLVSLKITETPDRNLTIEATANLFNPSPIGIELGTLNIQLEYNGTVMSRVTADDVFLVSQNNTLTMKGITYLPKTDADRDNFAQVIESYLTGKPINTTARILSVIPKNGPVDWLDSAVKGLPPLSTTLGKIKPPELMKGIDFGEMSLKFTPDAPYSPTISAKHATADFKLPFDVNVNISSVSQRLKVYYKETAIFESDVPSMPATNTATQVVIDIPDTQLQVLSHDLFSQFLSNLTASKGADVVIVGESDVIATSIIGTAPVRGLAFNVSTTISGFNQFKDGSSSNSDVKVLGGTSDQIYMGFTVNIVNPLKNSFSVGKVTFQTFYQNKKIGSVVINDLSIGPGTNSLSAYGTLDDPAKNNGKELLNAVLSQQEVTLDIKGFENSTDVVSLIPAFKAMDMQSTMAPLQQNLVQSTKMVTDPQTSTTSVIAAFSNIYDAPISIYSIRSTFSFGGNTLGSIDLDVTDNPFFILGNSVQSIQLPVNLIYDPSVLLSMTRNLALQNHLDVSVLDALIVLTKIDVPDVDVNVNPTPQALASFNLANFITTALARIPTTVNVETRVALGFYIMPLKYQQDMIATTDSSVLQFVPQMAQPVIEQFMGQTDINFNTMFIKNIDVASFDVDMTGQIAGTGPLRAEITFPNGATVSSNNIVLGTVQMSAPLIVDPITGVTINGTSKFLIADVTTFSNFVQSIYAATTVQWDMSTSLIIDVSGIKMGPITLNKSFNLPGFSGLQNARPLSTSISAGQDNSVSFSAVVALTNPTIVGMELGTIVLNLSADGKQLTVVTATNVVIVPKSDFTITFQGSISLSDGGFIGVLFGPTSPQLTVQGVSITPPRATGDVQWLTAIFRQLSFTVPFDPSALFKPKTA